ncbi:MAG TPA: four helix bundle protein [Longimicrobium sp.]
MNRVSSHRDLDVWRLAMDLVVDIYRASAKFPSDERFGLTSQIRRAAVSVPANIAEGNSRSTRKDYAAFLSIAKGSLAEIETFLLIAIRLGYVTEERVAAELALLTRVSKMLRSLRARLLAP